MTCVTEDDYKRIASQFHYILDKLCGTGEDWVDAIEGIGVRYLYWNGSHQVVLGKNAESNARIAVFSTREEAKDWCNKVNKHLFEEEDES